MKGISVRPPENSDLREAGYTGIEAPKKGEPSWVSSSGELFSGVYRAGGCPGERVGVAYADTCWNSPPAGMVVS